MEFKVTFSLLDVVQDPLESFGHSRHIGYVHVEDGPRPSPMRVQSIQTELLGKLVKIEEVFGIRTRFFRAVAG